MVHNCHDEADDAQAPEAQGQAARAHFVRVLALSRRDRLSLKSILGFSSALLLGLSFGSQLQPAPTGNSPDALHDQLQRRPILTDATISETSVAGGEGPYPQRQLKTSLKKEGGNKATEDAVLSALKWLERAQSPDGRWDSDAWQNLEKHPKSGHNAGDPRFDVGLTGLALLAFFGSGHSQSEGDFKATIEKGLQWLLKQVNTDGRTGYYDSGERGIAGESGTTMYNHAIATATLCEAYAISRDEALKSGAVKAIAFIGLAQNPNGGWRYGIQTGNSDTSLTGWMVAALKAAQVAGLDIPAKSFAGAQNWIKRVTADDGRIGYSSAGRVSGYLKENELTFERLPAMTASGALSRIFMGELTGTVDLQKASRILLANKPSWPKLSETKKANFYYWYFGSYAMFQVGGTKWSEWNKAMQKAVLDKQCKGGEQDGSWPPVDEWSVAGGRVYATAMNALTLEVYYRYPRGMKSK